MFGFYNYNKPGKGVQKRDPNQSRISLYFELLGRKFWSLFKVNFVYILFMIPTFILTAMAMGFITSRLSGAASYALAQLNGLDVPDVTNSQFATSLAGFDLTLRVLITSVFVTFFGAGPATAGVTYILRNYGREEHVWLWSDTWRNIRINFKQSILLWIIDLFVVIALVAALDVYSKMSGMGIVALGITGFVFLLYLMMHIYVYQMMITFELPFKNVIKNSIIMSIMTTPKTLLLLLILAVVHIGIPYLLLMVSRSIIGVIIFVVLELLFLPAASMFTTNFFIYPGMEKLIKQALAEAEGKSSEAEEINEQI